MRFSELRSSLLVLSLLVIAGFVLSFDTPAAWAQTSQGTLTGVVRDAAGAVIVGADVTATNASTEEVRTTKSSSLGAYRFDAIAPGQYTLVCESSGFERFQATGITILPSQLVSYDPVLNLGRVDQTVSVVADTVLLDKENASLSGTIPEVAMKTLPIFTLNPIEVLTTVPGVQIVSNTGLSNGDNIQVSGARPRANNFLVDGEEINDAGIGGQAVQPDIPDMYSDTVIYTHNPPAEYGRASGGVVNLITKGGTNEFHGSAWELYSGSGLNATDGQTRQAVPKEHGNKARFDEHQVGFVAGGPIFKNKLFAFGAGQWSRVYGDEQRSSAELPDGAGIALLQSIATQTTNATTATQAALMLSFLSASPTKAPAYLTTFNKLSGGASSNLGQACPTSTACSLTTANYQALPIPEQNPDTQWSYRIDYTPWSKDTFSARYLHDRSSLTPDFFANSGSLPGFDTFQGGPSELGQGAWTHIFSSRIINEFRVSETRPGFFFAPTAETQANPLFKFETINITNLHYLGPNQNFPQGRSQDLYQMQDTVSLTYGRNTVRVGADIGRRIEKDLVSQNAKGALTFAAGGSGSSAAGNFLLNQLGPSGTATVTYGSTRLDPHSWRSGIFGQDDIKVSENLTLNLGVRYDYFTAPEDVMPYPAMDPNNPYQAIGTVIPVAPDKNNIAPRVGFAYSPSGGGWLGNGNTVVRGGFGVFFDSDFTNIAINSQQSAPNAVAGTLTGTAGGGYPNGLPNATSLIPTIPKVLNPFSSVTSVVKNLVSPYTEEWNLGIERLLPGQFAMSITYVGSHGVKLFANQQFNFIDFNTGQRLNTTRGVINARANSGSSSYNGLEVGLKRNFSHGIAMTGSYVYSKDLDNASEVFTPTTDSTSYSADLRPGGRRYDWGNSTYDHRQYAAFTYVWSPAGFHSANRGTDTLLSAVTRHWTISGASRFQSGAYSTIDISGLDTNGDGSTANDRPVLSNPKAPIDSVGIDGYYGSSFLGGPATPGTYYDVKINNTPPDYAIVPVDPSSVHWLIKHAANLGPQEIGRNSFLNPGELYNDIALEKDVPTSLLHLERGQFVFRAEAQNLANHNNIGGYDSGETDLLNVGTSGFLNASAVREANNRALRFWGKFVF
jgi:outer membrane receptor protein involved in Fe transport